MRRAFPAGFNLANPSLCYGPACHCGGICSSCRAGGGSNRGGSGRGRRDKVSTATLGVAFVGDETPGSVWDRASGRAWSKHHSSRACHPSQTGAARNSAPLSAARDRFRRHVGSLVAPRGTNESRIPECGGEPVPFQQGCLARAVERSMSTQVHWRLLPIASEYAVPKVEYRQSAHRLVSSHNRFPREALDSRTVYANRNKLSQATEWVTTPEPGGVSGNEAIPVGASDQSRHNPTGSRGHDDEKRTVSVCPCETGRPPCASCADWLWTHGPRHVGDKGLADSFNQVLANCRRTCEAYFACIRIYESRLTQQEIQAFRVRCPLVELPPPIVFGDVQQCGPDVTDWMIDAVYSHAKSLVPISLDTALRRFYQLATVGSNLDFKHRNNAQYHSSSGCPRGLECQGSVTLCDHCVKNDVIGNIMYGFVGSARFSVPTLRFGADMAARGGGLGGIVRGFLTGGDTEADRSAIGIGVELYNRRGSSEASPTERRQLFCAHLDSLGVPWAKRDTSDIAHVRRPGDGWCPPCKEKAGG